MATANKGPALLRPEPGPDTLKEVRWGGQRLAALRGGPEHAGRAIGESWELSTLPGSESRARGQPLSAALGGPLPFLVKLIDTARPLSIQVHPQDGDEPGEPGKEEAWVVLAATAGAQVLAGVRDGVDATMLAQATERARVDAADDAMLLACLRTIDVGVGTCIVVPAGTVHAIGGGILLAEIQQPTDRTYRLHDYGSGRPIQPERALAVARVAARARVWQPGEIAQRLEGRHVWLEPARGPRMIVGADTGPRFDVVIAVTGAVEIECKDEHECLQAGELALVREDAQLRAASDTLHVRAGIR